MHKEAKTDAKGIVGGELDIDCMHLITITERPQVYCEAKQSGQYSKYDIAADHMQAQP